MHRGDSNINVIQNLQDAGCKEEIVSLFLNYFNQGKVKDALKILQVYRKSILEDLHSNQRQIDCLDYFIYQIEKTDVSAR